MSRRMSNSTASTEPQHFLALPRPDVTLGQLPRGLTDTTTLAAHDFDVDNRTGFMPPEPPLSRLPGKWETWETILDSALARRLKLHNGLTTSEDDRAESAAWRGIVREVCTVGSPPQSECPILNDIAIADHIFHFTTASCIIN